MEIGTLAASAAALFLASSLFSHDVALRLLLLALTIVLTTAMVASRRERARLTLLPPIWLPFLLWGAWAALTLLWSIDPALTRKELQNEVVYTGIALVVCHVAAQARGSERIFLSLGALATVLLCAVALVDFARLGELGLEGWHGGAGNLSGLLLLIFPCAVMIGWYASRNQQPRLVMAAGFIAVLVLFAAYATLNRTVWIGIILEALILGVAIVSRSPRERRRRTLAVAAVGAVLVVAMGGAIATLVHEERLASHEVLPLEKDPRLHLWAVAVPLAAERPLTGHGFGRGALHEPLFRATHNHMLWHSHNIFIDAALQTGVPGLLLFLALLSSIVWCGWRLARSPADRQVACGVAIIAMVAGIVTRNMTDLVWQRHVTLFFWGLTGVIMAWGARPSPHLSAPTPS